ncbi:hypothetical protein TIFTF001_017505 [Ficus carica]|uniref:Phytocyanin domain-containing protein n=1 Tax=Ficus carica TaxID=3494 RepID=A0AA88AQV9_FICCA|nr:hypothetical protein TIFTF001_017505 [Ficus carica]
MSAVVKALFVLLLAAPVVYGVQYTVGDTSGWSSGVDYGAWTSDKNFTVGDTLVFSYDTSHKVDEVSKDDYDSCTASNVIKSHGGTTVTIDLSKPGTLYFICPTPGHCSGGMKLKVDVTEASTPSGSPPTTPASSSSPPPPSGSSSPGTASPPSPSGAASIANSMMKLAAGGSVVLATLLLHYMG